MSRILQLQSDLIATLDQSIAELTALLRARGIVVFTRPVPVPPMRGNHERDQAAAIHRREAQLTSLEQVIERMLPTGIADEEAA